VQGDRLEVEFDAFGEGEECWVVDFQVIPATRPSAARARCGRRSRAARQGYPHASGQSMRIKAMAVDSGYLTQDVYDFCRRYAHRHVIATKGDGAAASRCSRGRLGRRRPPRPEDQARRAAVARRHRHGEGAALQAPRPRGAGPGYQHLPRWLPDEYFEQLTSEKLVRRQARGVEKHEWIKTRERNEALDLKILCYAAAIYAGLQRDELGAAALLRPPLHARSARPAVLVATTA
jgi:phage terminase large subunit GpA-like protein